MGAPYATEINELFNYCNDIFKEISFTYKCVQYLFRPYDPNVSDSSGSRCVSENPFVFTRVQKGKKKKSIYDTLYGDDSDSD